jgi:hypothetical protein
MTSRESEWFNKEEYIKESNKRIKPWWDALEKESDMSVGIISGTLLDILLEEVIRTFYVKEKGVAELFKNDHLLMNLYSKINVAYYSGYIPKVIYHDLRIICRIRNRFAHSLLGGLDFKEETLVSLIRECELRPKTMDSVSAPRLKYELIVQQLADCLIMISHTGRKVRSRKFVEHLNMEKWDFSEATLTKSKIKKILRERGGNLSER